MSLFRNLGFQKKIMLSFLVMMLLIGCVTSLFSYQMTAITADEMNMLQTLLPQTSALLEVKNQITIKTNALKMYTATLDPSYLDQYYSHLIDSSRFENLTPTRNNAALFSSIDLIRELDFLFLNKVDPLLKADNLTAVNYVLSNEVQPLIEQMERDFTFSLDNLERETKQEFQKTTESIRVSLFLTYTVSVAAVLFASFCTFYFRRELLRPIQSLLKQVRDVSRGAFGQEIVYPQQDEFRELADEFNKMSRNLKTLFEQDQAKRTILMEEKNLREQILNSLPVGIISRPNPQAEIHVNHFARQWVKLDENGYPLAKKEGEIIPFEESSWFVNQKMTLCKKDGTPFIALVSYIPLFHHQQDGETGWMITFLDITEQEQVQAYLNQSEKLAMVGQLAAGAAHEIRNPLAVIYGFIQLMQQRFSEQEGERYYLPLILKEIERVNQIVTELLLLSKPSIPNYREVKLRELLNAILPLINAEAALHGIEIVDRDIVDTSIHVDVEQFKQILLNLMKNSIEAMKEGGILTIENRLDDTFVHIVIRDTGEGIPAEYLGRIFDPFFSLKEKGTGLGLPISRRMVENHRGTMQIESTVGKGTTITISLPRQPKNA